MLPDCLASRLSSTLDEVETVVETAQSSPSMWAAVDELRSDITLLSAARWIRRRVRLVIAALNAIIYLVPDRFEGCLPTITSFRNALGIEQGVLVELRSLCANHLPSLPPPVGFGPRPPREWCPGRVGQQRSGPGPPDPIW
jgi:hypothetical protein